MSDLTITSTVKIDVSLHALVLPLALLSCAPTLQEVTAGRIGCPPDDITIDEGDTGWAWTATCHGRTYYCSRSGGTVGGITNGPGGLRSFVGTTSGEAACKEGQAKVEAPPEEGPKLKTTDPPKGAGGFVFGSAPADASKLCTSAGKTWTEPEQDRAHCAGTAVDIGFTATSRLRFCDGALCGVTLLVSLEDEDRSQWVKRYRTIRGALAAKYGSPTSRSEDILTTCSTGIPQCLSRGAMTLEAKWSWTDVSSVRLVLGQIEGVVRIGLVYRAPREESKPNADGL